MPLTASSRLVAPRSAPLLAVLALLVPGFAATAASRPLPGAAPAAFTPIHDVQGSGSTSPMVGMVVVTEGIVTARRANAFFLQSTDAEADANPATSEGIVVFTSTAPPAAAAVGNRVSVAGTVAEFLSASDPLSPPLTELTSPTVVVLSTGNPLPAAAALNTGDTSPGGSMEQLERFEGMRVSVASLTVIAPTEGSVNEVTSTSTSSGVFYGVITGIARPFREPGVELPDALPSGSPCCVPRFDGNPERLRVDSDVQAGAGAIEVTAGAVVTGLTGVLDYSPRAYTLLPDPSPAPVVTGLVSPSPVRAQANDEFTIGSCNAGRLFDTIDDPGVTDVVLTSTAYQRRLNKLSLAIRNLMGTPDILGLQGVDNLGTLQALATRINSDAVTEGQGNPAYVAYLVEGNDPTGIDVGFLVKSARVTGTSVTQQGLGAVYVNPATMLSAILFERPPLVLTATIPAAAGDPLAVTVVLNDFRSLGNIAGDGAGQTTRAKRAAQAEFVANLVQARQVAAPGERIAVIGGINAYEFNDGYVDMMGTLTGRPSPATQVVLASGDLVDPDLTNLVEGLPTSQRYSFSTLGTASCLDHVLVNEALAPQFTDMAFARCNADFPESYRNDGTRPERAAFNDMPVAYFRVPGTVSVLPGGDEPALGTLAVAPSPLREDCEIRFSLARPADVALELFDVAGRRVASLAAGRRASGVHTVHWNGRHADGAPVAEGVYFARLRVAGLTRTQRLVVVR